jgi:hypothetical protein
VKSGFFFYLLFVAVFPIKRFVIFEPFFDKRIKRDCRMSGYALVGCPRSLAEVNLAV